MEERLFATGATAAERDVKAEGARDHLIRSDVAVANDRAAYQRKQRSNEAHGMGGAGGLGAYEKTGSAWAVFHSALRLRPSSVQWGRSQK